MEYKVDANLYKGKCSMILKRLILIVEVIVLGFFIPLNPASGHDSETALKLMRMSDVYGVDSRYGNIWAVATKGMIFHSCNMGETWELQETGVKNELFSVSFTENNEGWAVGRFGVILHTADRGEHWEIQQKEIPGDQANLYKVQFVNNSVGWTVGEWGTILHTTDGGKTWMRQTLLSDNGEEDGCVDTLDEEGFESEKSFDSDEIIGIDDDEEGDDLSSAADKFLYGLYFLDHENGWVVGESGTIGHTIDGGNTWELQKNPHGDKSLYGVYFKDAEKGWACGIDGTIIQTNDGGTTWNLVQNVPSADSLYDIVLADNTMWAVGKKGVIISSKNGGLTWECGKGNPVVYYWLIDLAYADGNLVMAGGHGSVMISPDNGKTWK